MFLLCRNVLYSNVTLLCCVRTECGGIASRRTIYTNVTYIDVTMSASKRALGPDSVLSGTESCLNDGHSGPHSCIRAASSFWDGKQSNSYCLSCIAHCTNSVNITTRSSSFTIYMRRLPSLSTPSFSVDNGVKPTSVRHLSGHNCRWQ